MEKTLTSYAIIGSGDTQATRAAIISHVGSTNLHTAILLVDDDIEVTASGIVKEMVQMALRPCLERYNEPLMKDDKNPWFDHYLQKRSSFKNKRRKS
jgi:hypothetical protein